MLLNETSLADLNNSQETPRVDWSDRVRHDALLDQALALVGVCLPSADLPHTHSIWDSGSCTERNHLLLSMEYSRMFDELQGEYVTNEVSDAVDERENQ
jgi:hypothetical protein